MPSKDAKKKLKEYAAKRDFKKTPEPGPEAPAPKPKKAKPLQFAVQKHLASHLHYDLRLEHNGVLLSWAVPKGPSLNPADKRMAVRTEDHPFMYVEFEGVIPSGYGAGVMALWDRGTWEPAQGFEDVGKALAKGELKFSPNGVKLKGSWVLVRIRRKDEESRQEQWLMIKHRDEWAGDVDITTFAPQSVKTFGDLANILAGSKHANAFEHGAPVQGGETGKLFRKVISDAKALAAKPTALKTSKKKTAKKAAPKKTSKARK